MEKKKFDNLNETKIHENSFTEIKNRLKNKYPNLKIETFLATLNKKVGKF